MAASQPRRPEASLQIWRQTGRYFNYDGYPIFWQEGGRGGHRERWVAPLQTTQVPLRLINGLEDPVSGAHMVQRYRELVPRPDVVPLQGIGHYPQMEAPEAVLGAFLPLGG